MNNLITTIVVEAQDGATTQADITATSVADSASSGKLIIQRDGAFATGELTNTTADQLIKLSGATTMSNGTVSVMGSSEFKLADIASAHYQAGNAGTAGSYSLDYASAVAVGGQLFLRLERRDGIGVNDSETFSGETLTQLKAEFDARVAADLSEFSNVTLTIATDVLQLSVAAQDNNSDVLVSANDNVTISLGNAVDKRGSLTQAQALEKAGFITQGAYNQYGFPIVIPETSTAANQDYGIYTIELRKTVGRRIVFETIKILIADDEANGQKTVNAIQNLLGLSVTDVTVPTAVTSTAFASDSAGTAATSFSIAAAADIFVKVVGAEVGATIAITVASDGSEDDVTASFTVATGTETFQIAAATSDLYAESVTLTASAVLTDAAGNVSAAASTEGTATIAA